MIELGAMIGAAAAGYTADRYSRKHAILMCVFRSRLPFTPLTLAQSGVVFFIVGSAIQTGSVAYAMLVVGRLIGGTYEYVSPCPPSPNNPA